MTVGRVAGRGDRDPVARLEQSEEGENEPAGRARGDDDPLRLDRDAVGVAAGDDVDAAYDLAIRRTRRFARRQRMWFRRDPRITWLATSRNPCALLPALLATWT